MTERKHQPLQALHLTPWEADRIYRSLFSRNPSGYPSGTVGLRKADFSRRVDFESQSSVVASLGDKTKLRSHNPVRKFYSAGKVMTAIDANVFFSSDPQDQELVRRSNSNRRTGS